MIPFKELALHLLLQTFDFHSPRTALCCILVFLEIVSQTDAAGVPVQRHDGSSKVKLKHLALSLVAGCQFRKQLSWYAAEFSMSSAHTLNVNIAVNHVNLIAGSQNRDLD